MAEQMYKTAGTEAPGQGPSQNAGQDGGPQGAGQSGPSQKDGKKGDDVIDADYKEV
jgi:hypothetical protein